MTAVAHGAPNASGLIARCTGLHPISIALLVTVPVCVTLMHEFFLAVALLIPVLLVLHAAGWFGRTWRDSPTDLRLAAAVCFGLAATWIAMGLTHAPYVETRAVAASLPHWEFKPSRAAGFPVHGILGHHNAGATEKLTWNSVLAVLANWTLWMAIAWIVLMPKSGPTPGRSHAIETNAIKTNVVALVAALGSTLFAIGYFTVTLD